MSDLVRYYREYYREQTPESLDSLFRSMLEYDFSSYHEDMRRVLAMWRETKCAGEPIRLKSNGSTAGDSRRFGFFPHFGLWRQRVESFLRGKDRKTIMVVAQLGRADFEPFRYSEVLDNPQKDIDVVGNWLSDEDIAKLFALVSDTCAGHGPVNLYAMPDIWTCLVTNPAFRLLVEQNRSDIGSFVNSDYDAIFKRIGVHVRDQMIDWGTGLNFFDCEFGTRHFLPIFLWDGRKCLNLVNLARHGLSSDDDVVFGDAADLCRCGSPRLPVRIRPHFRNMIVGADGRALDLLPLHDQLEGHYANLQFHQSEDGVVRMFYATTSELRTDFEVAEQNFREEGLEIEFVRGKYYSIGRKRYRAWRSNSVSAQDFLIPEKERK